MSNIKNETKTKITEFIQYHLKKNNRLVVITSGGTTVPLEAKTVRFIDNFSMGTRGSVSGEEFIKKSYAVLFLHRKRSLVPYERKLQNLNVLDLMHYASDRESFKFDKSASLDMKMLFDTYTEARKNNLLLKIEYTSVFDYLSFLEYTCRAVDCLKSNVLLYLAAAVSDFYIPKAELPEHKIQSSKTELQLNLKPVPKCLGKIRLEWCSQAFIVSFKLETDVNLLNEKCKRSLANYKQDVVVGNILEKRKESVSVMKSNGDVNVIRLSPVVEEIEELIIGYLENLHTEFIKKG